MATWTADFTRVRKNGRFFASGMTEMQARKIVNAFNDLEAEIEKLVQEIARLRIQCGKSEMIEGDYATLLKLEDEIAKLKESISNFSGTCGQLHTQLLDAQAENEILRTVLECIASGKAVSDCGEAIIFNRESQDMAAAGLKQCKELK